MNNTMKEAIYDAVVAVTGLEGVWENQKGAVALNQPHFSLRLLFPGRAIDRKGEVVQSDDSRDLRYTRLATTIQVKIFGQEDSNMISAHNNVLWHKHLNQGGIVGLGLLRSLDITSVYVDWESVYLYDFELVYMRSDLVQPEETSDVYIEQAGIKGEIDGIENDFIIPPDSEDDYYAE